jgi:phosphatidylinositol alpha-mannosyltransferase
VSERPLRVALTCPYSLSVFGGVQVQVLALARALRGLGVDARVLAPTDGPPPEPGITSVGTTRRVPINGSVAPMTAGRAVSERTLEALRSFSPDVLHLHEPLSPGMNHAALVGTTLPAVGTFHAAHPGRNGWYDAFRLPLRLMVERLAVRTAVSVEAQRNVEAFGGACEILSNGVDVERYATAVPTPTPVPAVLFVGRHEPRKGLGVLLDAFARLEGDAVLWILGEGPQTRVLQNRALQNRAGDGPGADRIHWLGSVPESEKASRLAGATVACFPSIEGESFGVVLLEAMAAGVAVVASDLTGYRDVARADCEALLAPPGDAEALAGALRRALDDAPHRDALIAAGRRRAAEFSMTRVAEAFVEHYERAIASSTSTGPRPAKPTGDG